jgi:hypothetical protein
LQAQTLFAVVLVVALQGLGSQITVQHVLKVKQMLRSQVTCDLRIYTNLPKFTT